MTDNLTVVKIGGSLFRLPDLGTRLRDWLAQQDPGRIILVPGGGAMADVVRDLDRQHGLGEEAAHWLALRVLSLNAELLKCILTRAELCHPLGREIQYQFLDAHAFLKADEGQPGSLPHSWSVTSDSVAARVAIVSGAVDLVLLKSVEIPQEMAWEEAARHGLVDAWFPQVIRQSPLLQVRAVNLRTVSPG